MQIKLIFTEMFGTLPRFEIESFTSLRNCRDKLQVPQAHQSRQLRRLMEHEKAY